MIHSFEALVKYVENIDNRLFKVERKIDKMEKPVSLKKYLELQSEIAQLQRQCYELKARLGEADIYNYFENNETIRRNEEVEEV